MIKAIGILAGLGFVILLSLYIKRDISIDNSQNLNEVSKVVKKKQKDLEPHKIAPKPKVKNSKHSLVKKEVKITQKKSPRKKKPDLEKSVHQKVKAIEFNREGFAPIDKEGNLYLESIAIDEDLAIFHGDIIVGLKDDIMKRVQDGSPVKVPKPKLWTSGEIAYFIDENLPKPERVLESISYFNSFNIVTFKRINETSEASDYLYFKKGKNNCYSYVGKQGGRQAVVLSDGCGFKEINHELLHALGFFHEQNREDRDEYIEIHWYNIDEKYHSQFKKLLNEYQHLNNTAFDYESLMLYPPMAFSLYENDYAITRTDGTIYPVNDGYLSEIDLQRLKKAYKK